MARTSQSPARDGARQGISVELHAETSTGPSATAQAARTAARIAESPQTDPVEVFTLRCRSRAKLWHNGEIDLHTAVDELQDAAKASGLIAQIGQDRVQQIMSEAFADIVCEDLADDDTFAAACRAADDKRRRQPHDPRIDRLQPLMDDSVSLERAYSELKQLRPVPLATLRAAEFLVREGDAERFRKWLNQHSPKQRAVIRKHLEAKRCR